MSNQQQAKGSTTGVGGQQPTWAAPTTGGGVTNALPQMPGPQGPPQLAGGPTAPPPANPMAGPPGGGAPGGGVTNPQQQPPPQAGAPGSPQYNQMNTALQTAPMNAAVNTFQTGGMGGTATNAMGQMMGLGGPGGQYADLYGRAGGPGAADQYLTGTAQGQFLGGSPHLDAIINKGAQDITDQTGQMFAAGGRYGSGIHQGTLQDTIGNFANTLRHQNYTQERQNQMNAAQAMEAAQQGRMGQQQGALGGMMNALMGGAGLEQQGFGNMLGMINALPTIQGNKVFDAQQQMGVGAMQDQRNQQQLQDLINRWTQTDMQDWSRLGGLLTAGTGAAGPYGTQTGQTQTQGGWGQTMGGLGGLLMGLGQFGGLFSDERLKEDIVPVGSKNGIPLYEFRYKWSPQRYRGVLAGDIERVNPKAVGWRHGYRTVDYDLIGIKMEPV